LLALQIALLYRYAVGYDVSGLAFAQMLSIILVFATLFWHWLAGDRLVAVQLLGAALILSAPVLSEVIPTIMRRSETHEKKGDVPQ
jgi:hypothetical protein